MNNLSPVIELAPWPWLAVQIEAVFWTGCTKHYLFYFCCHALRQCATYQALTFKESFFQPLDFFPFDGNNNNNQEMSAKMYFMFCMLQLFFKRPVLGNKKQRVAEFMDSNSCFELKTSLDMFIIILY